MKAYRSLVRIVAFSRDKKFVYVDIPSWDSKKLVKIQLDKFPEKYWNESIIGMRFFAMVDIGNENTPEIFEFLEEAKKPTGKWALLLRENKCKQ